MQNAPLSPDAPLSDAAREHDGLLAAARSGAPWAFAQLVRQHQSSVFTLALRFTGNRADAEELAQDTFLEMHDALSQVSSALHLRHWLLRTVSHRSLNLLRQRGRRPQLISFDAAVEVSTNLATIPEVDHLAALKLHALLFQLAPDARAVMLLRLQEDLDPSDIATVLAMPLNTVKSHLRRSLDWLRMKYAGEDNGI
jgi:RNA polymerase sigma-70 factor, ECF subfamily